MHRVRSVYYGRWDSWCEISLFLRRSVDYRIYVREGDAASLLMALAACLLGYGEVGLWLQSEAKRPRSGIKIEDNPYKRWIEDYSGEGYQAAVKVGIGACCN